MKWRTTVICLAACVAQPLEAASGNVPNQTDHVSARDLIETTDFMAVAASPDGRWVAFQSAKPAVDENSVRLEWSIVPVEGTQPARVIADGGAPMHLPKNGSLISPTVNWSPDSRSFYFQALHGEVLAVWRADLDGGVRAVTQWPADIERFTLAEDGKRLIFESGPTRDAIKEAESDEYAQGVRLTAAIDAQDGVHHNMWYRGRKASIRNDLHGALQPGVTLLADVSRHVTVLDLHSGETRAASADEKRVFEEAVAEVDPAMVGSPEQPLLDRLPHSSKKAFAEKISGGGSETVRTVRYRLRWEEDANKKGDHCKTDVCVSDRLGLRGIRWRRNSSEITFVVQQDSHSTELHAWNIRTGKTRLITSEKGLLGTGGDNVTRWISAACPTTDKYAICVTSGAARPPVLERIDLDTGARRVLADPNNKLRSKLHNRVELIEWNDKWGRSISGILVLPEKPSSIRLPLVITGYMCGGFLRGGSGRDVPEHVLAAEGIAALCVDMNMRNVYGQPHPSGKIPAGPLANLQSNLDAWESAVEFLNKRGSIDPARVGISGQSFGASSVHYATWNSDKFAVASACQVGATDPMTYYWLSSRADVEQVIISYYGMTPPEDSAAGSRYRAMSSALNAEKIRIPVLVQTSERELRYGIQYFSRMMTLKKPVELYVFPDEQHQFWQPMHRLAWNTRFVDWFRFWLTRHESSDPAKLEQYARWRSLREEYQAAMRSPIAPAF